MTSYEEYAESLVIYWFKLVTLNWHIWGFLIITFIIALIGGRTPVKASIESTDFVKEKKENSKNCPFQFLNSSELMDFPLQQGDLIEFRRFMGIYDHWGGYVGDNQVVHLVPHGPEIRIDDLNKVAGGGKCRVNNLEVASLKRNLMAVEKKLVADTALNMLSEFKNGQLKVQYDLVEYNCEHLMTHCAFGTPFSEQASNAKDKDSVNYIGNSLSAVVHSKFDINE